MILTDTNINTINRNSPYLCATRGSTPVIILQLIRAVERILLNWWFVYISILSNHQKSTISHVHCCQALYKEKEKEKREKESVLHTKYLHEILTLRIYGVQEDKQRTSSWSSVKMHAVEDPLTLVFE